MSKANELKKCYKDIMGSSWTAPDWAVRKADGSNFIKCTIPFVGKLYEEQRGKILVYGSAENLVDYHMEFSKRGQPLTDAFWLEDDEIAVDRHRSYFDDEVNVELFFPKVHMRPMDQGMLATAALYVASQLCPELLEAVEKPVDFYEKIAFGNYGKYSDETEAQKLKRNGMEYIKASRANRDYAGNKEMLSYSHEFIKADIEVLQPDIIIMPEKMYNTDAAFLNTLTQDKERNFIKIYQMNSRVINCHIANQEKWKADPTEHLHPTVKKWSDIVGGKYKYVFNYLDDKINEVRYVIK